MIPFAATNEGSVPARNKISATKSGSDSLVTTAIQTDEAISKLLKHRATFFPMLLKELTDIDSHKNGSEVKAYYDRVEDEN